MRFGRVFDGKLDSVRFGGERSVDGNISGAIDESPPHVHGQLAPAPIAVTLQYSVEPGSHNVLHLSQKTQLSSA